MTLFCHLVYKMEKIIMVKMYFPREGDNVGFLVCSNQLVFSPEPKNCSG